MLRKEINIQNMKPNNLKEFLSRTTSILHVAFPFLCDVFKKEDM